MTITFAILAPGIYRIGKGSILPHPCPPPPPQGPLNNKSVIILQSSDLDSRKSYNPKVRTPIMFSLFKLQTFISQVYPWILVHVINISTLKEQTTSQSEGTFAVGRKDYMPQARKTTSGSISWGDLRQKGDWTKDPQRNMEKSQFHKILFPTEVSPTPIKLDTKFPKYDSLVSALKAEDKLEMKACNASRLTGHFIFLEKDN